MGLFYYALSTFTTPIIGCCHLKSSVYFETFKQYYYWILVALLLCLVIWNHRVYFETFKLTIIGFWWLFYYALSSEIIVSTLKLLNSTIIGFWSVFYYALSSEIIVSTLKHLNSTIVGFWWLFYYGLSSESLLSTLKILNSTIIGFCGSFTMPCRLKSSCLLWNF